MIRRDERRARASRPLPRASAPTLSESERCPPPPLFYAGNSEFWPLPPGRGRLPPDRENDAPPRPVARRRPSSIHPGIASVSAPPDRPSPPPCPPPAPPPPPPPLP